VRVAEAISLHLNITVPPGLGVEASLLSKGVSLDTVGRRVESMPAPALAAVARLSAISSDPAPRAGVRSRWGQRG
jgi:hypothetical protein